MLPERAAPRPLIPTSVQVVVDPVFLDRLTALRQTLAPTLTDPELELFALVAQRKGLDPFSGQIVAVKRNTNRGGRVTFLTGIDGYRSLAERTEQYLGSDEPVFGPACDCGHPTSYHPTWGRVIVHRLHSSGRVIDQVGKAAWHEFVPSEDFMWVSKPEVMLGKVAEAQALRKAFPWVLGDLYIPEEMARGEEPATPPAVVSARETVAARAAEVRQTTNTSSAADVVITDITMGAEDDPQDDDDGEAAPVPADPAPDAPGPSEAVPEPMSRERFGERIKAAGISRDRAREVSQRLYPDRKSVDLDPDEWGALWTALTTS